MVSTPTPIFRGLYSFAPTKGAFGSETGANIYYLPPVTGEDDRTMNVNKGGNAYAELEEVRGIYPAAGDLPMFESNGEINVTFDFIFPWLHQQYGSLGGGPQSLGRNDQAMLDFAMINFMQYVVEGGRGRLTEYYWAVDSAYNISLKPRTTDAYIDGTIEPKRTVGGTVITFTVKFTIPSGTWTLFDGTIIDFH